jgi:signal peptidase I
MTLRARRSSLRKWLREYQSFALMMVLLLAARSSLADHYVVPSGSMEPTLLPGDRVLVDKQAYGFRLPFTLIKLREGVRLARGDVAVFDSPADGTRLIKRVVALPGDLIEVRAGHVTINRAPAATGEQTELLDEHPVNLNLEFGGGPDVAPTRVPAGQVFVLGDARGNSRDSRFFGFVAESAIYAKAVRVYYRSEVGFIWLPL